jgi:hypothetical protein
LKQQKGAQKMNPNKMTNNRDKFHRDPSINAAFTKMEETVKPSPGADAVKMLKAKASKLSAGRVDTMMHNLEGKFSELRSQAKNGLHMVGDILETVGDQLSEKGYQKTGKMVHTASNKIERLLH